MTYWRAWSGFWALAATAAFGTAMLEWSPLTALLAALAVTLCAGVLLGLAPACRGRSGSVLRRRAARAATIGAGPVGWSALVSGAPPLALLTVVLLLGSSPWAVGLVRHAPGPGRARPAPPSKIGAPLPAATETSDGGPLVPHSDLGDLDDHQLCALWRGTFWQLDNLRSAAEVLAVVAVRQACLDELERRNPSALHAWLESGARASGGPERFWPHNSPGDADAA